MDTEPPNQIFEPGAADPSGPERATHLNQREPIFRIPPVTLWLVAFNVVIFVVMRFLPPGQEDAVVNTLGFNPATLRQPITAMGLLSLLTYQFLHGGWDHLGFNMISLLAFGSGIERALGPARYLAVYVCAGIAGALLQGLLMPGDGDGDGVMIGASGSISGLFGVLLALWNFQDPGRRQIGIVPMALLWIGLMAVTGILGVGAQGMPVAWVAHIGGFLVGLAYGAVLRARRRVH